ncbi:MAG: chitobiase/beta-hexosaminidase C-terminal domain-containing protein [Methanobacterium sp. ERen5]|nr:MAG: chitobiase/beta-hexosaminidase C-terminal domain-containing protein [Methanobacterium sp. ERen5]
MVLEGISNWGNLTLLNCTLVNNTASANGGAVDSRSGGFSIGGSGASNVQLNVINSTFITNTANQIKGEGGAINFESGTFNINNSTFISNSASDSGAVLGSSATLNFVNSKFINNTAVTDGGAIRVLSSTANINGCTFNGNTASNGVGGAVCGNLATNITLHYNWLQRDSADSGAEIYSDNGNMNATLNWWGSNNDRGAWIFNALYDPWIIVKANATPNSVINYGTSTINTNLWYDSNDKYIYGPDYNLPDVPAQFYRNMLILTESTIHNGSASTTLNFGAFISGVAKIVDVVGEEQTTVSILLKDTIPTVTVNKKGGLYNTSQIINFNLSEPATIYYTTDGSTPTFNSPKYYAPFKISSSTILKFFAIDLSGNPSAIFTEKFVIDTKAPTIVKVDPLNNAKKVSKTKPIALTFSEAVNIISSQIVLKNSSGKVINTTKILNGKLLTINHSALANGSYTLVIPRGCATDTAGNKIQAYSFKFTVG